MPYNKEELFKLPVEEKYELVMELWENLEDELMTDTDEEIKFAEERLEQHNKTPSEGLNWTEVIDKVKKKYGF